MSKHREQTHPDKLHKIVGWTVEHCRCDSLCGGATRMTRDKTIEANKKMRHLPTIEVISSSYLHWTGAVVRLDQRAKTHKSLL